MHIVHIGRPKFRINWITSASESHSMRAPYFELNGTNHTAVRNQTPQSSNCSVITGVYTVLCMPYFVAATVLQEQRGVSNHVYALRQGQYFVAVGTYTLEEDLEQLLDGQGPLHSRQ